jgi:hypothetical protein
MRAWALLGLVIIGEIADWRVWKRYGSLNMPLAPASHGRSALGRGAFGPPGSLSATTASMCEAQVPLLRPYRSSH